MPTDDEYSVRLISGFPIVIPTNTWIDIHPKDMKLSPSPKLVGSSNLNATRLLCYFEELKNKGSDSRFLNLQANSNPNDRERIEFKVYLYRDILARLCQLTPKPFIEIQLGLTYPSNIKYDIFLRQRWDLTELLETSKVDQWLDLAESIRMDSGNRTISCDIFLGWEEPQEDAESRPVNSTRINRTTLVGNLFAQESSKDLTIVVGNGAEVKCHRAVFQAQSDVLATMLSPDNGMKESETGRIELTENSEEGMTQFIRYLYGLDLTIDELSSDVAIELFKTAHKYKLTELEGYFGEMLITKQGEWFGPDDLLELYFHLKNLDEFKSLHEYLLSIMLGLAKEIKACARFNELKRTDPEAAYDLVWTLFEQVQK